MLTFKQFVKEGWKGAAIGAVLGGTAAKVLGGDPVSVVGTSTVGGIIGDRIGDALSSKKRKKIKEPTKDEPGPKPPGYKNPNGPRPMGYNRKRTLDSLKNK